MLEPAELKGLVSDLGECKLALGSSLKFQTKEEESTSKALRRSLIVRDLKAGERLDESLVKVMRLRSGLPPLSYLCLLERNCQGQLEKEYQYLWMTFLVFKKLMLL